MNRVTLGSVALLLGACSSNATFSDGGRDARAAADAASLDGGAADAGNGGLPNTIGPASRPAALHVPNAHDGVTPLPLIVLLHGYGFNGSVEDTYLGLTRTARTRGVYVVVPDGTPDAQGMRFWNATPACCDFGNVAVDDVAYLSGLIDELETLAPVDPDQVFFVGHSNGGFMSYRVACEHADRVAAIVSLAGSDFISGTDCVPSEPVSVLQIHGDLDATILYGGFAGGYPSAGDTVLRWAGRAECDVASATSGGTIDLDSGLAGEETDVLRYDTDCERDSALWTIRGGSHIPAVNLDFSGRVIDWLLAHGR